MLADTVLFLQPLDPLELFDGSAWADTSEHDSSDSEPRVAPPGQPVRSQRKLDDSWQQKFACMRGCDDDDANSKSPNARTIEVLQQMQDYYAKTADQWRALAYRKAISALQAQSAKIATKEEAVVIPGIGRRLADKIEEIAQTNRLRRLENTNRTPEDLSLQQFLGVYGVGISQASRWVAQGLRSLDDLRTRAELTSSQRIGVEHFHDFAQRIPRDEVRAAGEFVERSVKLHDPQMQVIIGGSYRRGAPDSGDIDLLITKHGATLEQVKQTMLDAVIPDLFRQNFLQASLSTSSRAGNGSKWHGASLLPSTTSTTSTASRRACWRRIDFLFVPGAELGAALIYFTGNDLFNRSIRLLANKKGMCLNQHGLFCNVRRRDARPKLSRGELLESQDERRIFAHLAVPWRPPEHRGG